ncbi:hypothetical protein CDAR_550791 [Caerostris darwini]|uniref:Uncharacterized protein n=1 Tax=Caerostris darwini TaxID=1538125 RepID=A0AAV4QK67_9ARAC|nr:hypothetical protein CDAR_550791 [Caerostris darwini]
MWYIIIFGIIIPPDLKKGGVQEVAVGYETLESAMKLWVEKCNQNRLQAWIISENQIDSFTRKESADLKPDDRVDEKRQIFPIFNLSFLLRAWFCPAFIGLTSV